MELQSPPVQSEMLNVSAHKLYGIPFLSLQRLEVIQRPTEQ